MLWYYNEEELTKALFKNEDNADSSSSSSSATSTDDEYDTFMENETSRIIQICSAYLKDYEQGRPTRLYPDSEYISFQKLNKLRFKRSSIWGYVLNIAKLSFFLASVFEGNELYPIQNRNCLLLVILTMFPISVFCFDLYISSSYRQPVEYEIPGKYRNPNKPSNGETTDTNIINPIDPKTVKERKRYSTFVFLSYFAILSIDTILFIRINSSQRVIRYKCIRSAALKPLLLLHYSSKAREALRALRLVLPMVLQAIILELFLTLTFSIIAFQLFGENENMSFDAFDNFFISFINMFQLSTTVNNPSLWIDIYVINPTSALFFISFMIVVYFYMHSLVVSVVYQSYIESMSRIEREKKSMKESIIQLTFKTLRKLESYKKSNRMQPLNSVPTKNIKKILQQIRPHYDNAKIYTLISFIDPSTTGYVDFHSFRNKMPEILHTSLKKRVLPNKFAKAVDIYAATLAIVNLIFVIVTSFPSKHVLSGSTVIIIGSIITFFSAIDIWIRISNANWSRIVKFDNVFDTLAISSLAFSIYAFTRKDHIVIFLITGRTIDMFRAARFFPTFRDIISMSGNVISLVIGPLTLVFFAVHLYCYVGMMLWGGFIKVGTIKDIAQHYDYLNFNTYTGGLLTMFQVLVVNDWHQIAKVYCAIDDAWIVYTFFVSAVIICVTILLNVFLSFFIGAFVLPSVTDTKLNYQIGSITTNARMDRSARSISFNPAYNPLSMIDEENNYYLENNNDDSPVEELAVSERQDFDTVIRNVTGNEMLPLSYLTDLLNLYGKMTSGSEVNDSGHLIYHQKSMHRSGNTKFQSMTSMFLDDEKIYDIIEDIGAKVCNDEKLEQNQNTVRHYFENENRMPGSILEISATCLYKETTVVLFVTKILQKNEIYEKKK